MSWICTGLNENRMYIGTEVRGALIFREHLIGKLWCSHNLIVDTHGIKDEHSVRHLLRYLI